MEVKLKQRKENGAKMKVSIKAPWAEVENVFDDQTIKHISPNHNDLDTVCCVTEDTR